MRETEIAHLVGHVPRQLRTVLYQCSVAVKYVSVLIELLLITIRGVKRYVKIKHCSVNYLYLRVLRSLLCSFHLANCEFPATYTAYTKSPVAVKTPPIQWCQSPRNNWPEGVSKFLAEHAPIPLYICFCTVCSSPKNHSVLMLCHGRVCDLATALFYSSAWRSPHFWSTSTCPTLPASTEAYFPEPSSSK